MPARILGISAFYHDSAAALVVGGDIVAAAQEERFTRIKHDHSFPSHAVEYCLREAGLSPDELDHVVFYDKPLLKFDRLLETYLAYAPSGLRSFLMAAPLWLKTKLHLPREIRKALGGCYTRRIAFTPPPSPFSQTPASARQTRTMCRQRFAQPPLREPHPGRGPRTRTGNGRARRRSRHRSR